MQERAILDAVVRLLQSEAIDTLSIEQIAHEAGLSRPRFYAYFESKYAALFAALVTPMDALDSAARFFDWHFAEESFADYIRRLMVGAAQVFQQYGPLFAACIQASHTDARLRDLWDAVMQSWAERAVTALDGWRKAGLISPISDDLSTLAQATTSMGTRLLYDDWMRHATSEQSNRTVEAIIAISLATFDGGAKSRRRQQVDGRNVPVTRSKGHNPK